MFQGFQIFEGRASPVTPWRLLTEKRITLPRPYLDPDLFQRVHTKEGNTAHPPQLPLKTDFFRPCTEHFWRSLWRQSPGTDERDFWRSHITFIINAIVLFVRGMNSPHASWNYCSLSGLKTPSWMTHLEIMRKLFIMRHFIFRFYHFPPCHVLERPGMRAI